MVLYAPLFLVDVVQSFLVYIDGKSIERKNVIAAITSGVLLLANIGAYTLCLYRHGTEFYPASIKIADMRNWLLDWTVISGQIRVLLMGMGLVGQGKISSPLGMTFMLTGLFAILTLFASGWIVAKGKEKGLVRARELVLFWYMTMAIVFFEEVLVARKSVAARYYFVTTILMPVIYAVALDAWSKRKGKRVALPGVASMLILLALFVVTGESQVMAYSAKPPVLTQVADYLVDNGYRYVTASYWNAGVLKGYTNFAVETQHVNVDGNLSPFEWIIDKRLFSQPHEGEPHILLLTDSEEETLAKLNGASYLMVQNYAQKVTEIGQFNLYELPENPCTLIKKVVR